MRGMARDARLDGRMDGRMESLGGETSWLNTQA